MESWNSPSVKMEPSPAESFLSLPGEPYPSLFASATMDPSDIMTPAPTSDDDKADLSVLSSLQAATMSVEPSSPAQDSPASDKKPTKKRKSWGQILPEPKTNLPPRKRAKTDDEKEQRRVERVLRNRRAAQSSRERKRLEVEALEERNKELEAALRQRERECMVLFEELKKRGGVPPKNSVTLSAELFSNPSLSATTSSLDDLLASQTQKTVNPASLSPALTPVPETAEDEDDLDQDDDTAALAPAPTETSPDLAQHPAEVLSSDLQCRSAEVSRQRWLQQPMSPALALYCQLTILLTSASTLLSLCSRPMTLIALSLRTTSSLRPTLPVLNTIIWLVTQPTLSRARRSTSTSSSKTTTAPSLAASSPSPPSTTLRHRLLRKILTSSPILARPLLDATLAALRLVQSEESLGVTRVSGRNGAAATPMTAGLSDDGNWLDAASLPSQEVLLTLMWAITVETQKLEGKVVVRPGKTSSAPKSMASTSRVSKPKRRTDGRFSIAGARRL